MSLKGGNAEHTGDPLPDRWSLNSELEAMVGRCHIDPAAIWPTQWIRLKVVKRQKRNVHFSAVPLNPLL